MNFFLDKIMIILHYVKNLNKFIQFVDSDESPVSIYIQFC